METSAHVPCPNLQYPTDYISWAQAARTLAVLMCKHEYDARYQTLDDKLYISQRYFPLITHVSDNPFLVLILSLSQGGDF